MTQEQLDEFEFELLPQALFHVMSDDIDDETGAKCEELILIQMLNSYPEVLKHKPLSYWVEHNIGRCYSADVKKTNDEIMRKQREKNRD